MTACVRDSKVNRSMLRFTLNGDILVTKRRIDIKKKENVNLEEKPAVSLHAVSRISEMYLASA